MGYTSFNLQTSVREWFINDYFGGDKHTVLEVSIVNRHELYAAVRNNETNAVFACIFLLTFSPKSQYNFTYKDMDECMCPFYFNCPEKILKLLSPLSEKDDNAREWREQCYVQINRSKTIKAIKEDTIIKTTKPISYVGIGEISYFKKHSIKGYKNVFYVCVESNGTIIQWSDMVRLNLKKYDFEIITEF